MIRQRRRQAQIVRLLPPLEYTVVKEWDDNDNAGWYQTEESEYAIYDNRNGGNADRLWKYVYLVENPTEAQRAEGYGEWSYTWSDHGTAWQYATEELGQDVPYGSFQAYYMEDGKSHALTWRYALKSKTYDPVTRTWVYVNAFDPDGGWGGWGESIVNPAIMRKRVWYQYDDPNPKSTRDRSINDLMKGRDAIIPFDVSGTAGSVEVYLDNLRNGKFTENGPAADAHYADIVLEDYLDMVDMHSITTDDVDLAYIDVNQPSIYGFTTVVKDETKSEDDPERYYDPPRYTLSRFINDYTNVRFEAYVGDEWIEVGEMHGTVLTGKNGGTAEGKRLNLPLGTQKVREIVETYGVVTSLSYTIGVRIHPSDWINLQIANKAKVSDYMMMRLDNYAKLYGVDNGVRSSWTLSDWDTGYIHGRIYRVAAWQNKSFNVTANDVVGRRLKIHTKAVTTQQSNVITERDYYIGIEEGDIPFTRAGTWYDLLPPGVEPDTSTVKLQSGDRIQDVWTIENYKDSGRTLLVVKASLAPHVSYTSSSAFPKDETYPQNGYKQQQVIEFDSYYSWQDVRMYGLETVRNTIAFETDDDEAGNLNGWCGEPDDPDFNNNKLTMGEVKTDKDLMTGLDDKRDDPSFVYAGADLMSDELDFYAEASIRKWVSVEGSGRWSYGHNNEVVVTEGGKYTYRIDVRCETDSATKDIIILDSIENYIPTEDKSDYGDAQWNGYFRGLNIQGLIDLGIDPIVYYSTKADLDISRGTAENENYNYYEEKDVIAAILNDPNGDWVRADKYTGKLQDVKAFAIDCRKKTDGTDFVIQNFSDSEEQPADAVDAFSFYVYMRAPAKSACVTKDGKSLWGAGKDAPENPEEVNPENADHNAHAYNNIFLDSTQVDAVGRETHAYIHWDYVKVGIIPFNLNVSKIWDDADDNDGLRGESVTVHLYADGEDTGETVVLGEDTDWAGVFPHVMRYDYDTMEPDYDGLDDGHYIFYSFVEDEINGYTMSYNRHDNDVEVVNKHVPETISIPFTKTWALDEDDLDRRPASITVKLYADGVYTGQKMTVKPDEEGNWAGEFTNIRKYKDHGREVVYTVEEDGVEDYRVSYDGTNITNTFHPFGDLEVSKVLQNATAAAAENEFSFSLTLKDKDGNDLLDEYPYEILKPADEQPEEGDTVYEKVSEGMIGNGGMFSLKGDWKLVVRDIPSHSTYQVTEDYKAGFTRSST